MNRNLILAMVLATSVVSSTPCFAAAATPVYGQAHGIKFLMRNDTTSELKLKIGDTLVAVAPGKTIQVQLPLGQQITAAEASGHYAQGAVLTTVAEMMKGNTVAIR